MFDRIKEAVSSITGGKNLGDLDLGGVEKYLEGVNWPVSKDELITAVKNNGAGEEVVGYLQGLDFASVSGPDDLGKLVSGMAGDVKDKLGGV